MTDAKINYINDQAKPFILPGRREGECVLLIHGFTGTPASMLPVAQFLNKGGDGFTVCAILLPGHGTQIDDLFGVSWKNWYQYASKELSGLFLNFEKVHVVGLSMGGNIALCLAATAGIDRIVTISTPVIIKNKFSYIAEFLSIFKKYQYWRPSPPEENDHKPEYATTYAGMPVRAIAEVRKITIATLRRLGRVRQPILIVQSVKDRTVHNRSGFYIYDLCKSSYKELLMLENSRHNPIFGPEQEHLFKSVYEFLTKEI